MDHLFEMCFSVLYRIIVVPIIVYCNMICYKMYILLPIHQFAASPLFVCQDPPFVFKHRPLSEGGDGISCSGNSCYYGYAIDLLERLASDLGFTYSLYDVSEGFYGLQDPVTGRWTGMIADLIADDDGHAVSNPYVYRSCGSRFSHRFVHRVGLFTNGNAGPSLALGSLGANPYFRCHLVNIASIYKQ